MNPALTIQIAHADPNAAPLTLNEQIDILNPLLSGEIQGSYVPYILQSSTPNVEDQDKAWIELDSGGRPLSIRIFYNGNWRRVYNGMLGEIRMFVGDPTNATNWTQPWDTTGGGGRGVVGGPYDGWQLCNGNNGAADLRDNFIVCGSAYSSPNWLSKVDGSTPPKQSGGAKNHMIVASDLPPIDSVNGLSSLSIHGNQYKSPPDFTHTDPQVIVDVNYAAAQPEVSQPIINYGSSPNGNPPVPQTPIPTLPPWVALGFMQFIGY